MLSRINTIAFNGLETQDVDLQVQISSGLPAFSIVGLPDKAVAESKERVRAALNSLGLSLPAKRITINLAPADLLKEGSHYDLAVALGILACMQTLPLEELSNYVALGELSLDGSILSVNGVLPAAIHANRKHKGLICPKSQGEEAVWSGLEEIIAAQNLLEIINHFKGTQIISKPEKKSTPQKAQYADLSDVLGQETAKRALEIAAAGGHNMLMIGPPGSGKTMLARRLPTILPPMTLEESLETTKIHSVAGKVPYNHALITNRPFRAPHHTISDIALVGGGVYPQPGEISLAHHGVLFLDELPEFKRSVLEVLRQPLEDRKICVSRAKFSVEYPANIMLIASMNPCPCGYYNHPTKECTCSPGSVQKYLAKISGPLLDRIDIHTEVTPVELDKITSPRESEPSAAIQQRVIAARKIQNDRYREYPGI